MELLKKSIISYFVLLILFTGLIIGVHTIPQSAIKENVITSTHTLQEEGLCKEFLNFTLFQMDNFTDTYMLNLAISADIKHPIEAGMMNYKYRSQEYMDIAYDTEKVARGETMNLEKSSYGRYWQGYQVILRPLLTILTYPQIRILNYTIFTLLIIAIIWLLAQKISTATACIFGVSLLIINFPIVPYSMQFSTCFYIAFISMILLIKIPSLTKSTSNTFCTFFIIGGITSYLDFLTTPQLTLGLPLIIYMLTKHPQNTWRTVIVISIAWGLGYGLLWASKWMMGYLLTGNNILVDAMESAKFRISTKYNDMDMSLSNILQLFWNKITTKNLLPFFFVGIIGILLFIGAYIKILKNKQVFKEYSWLLLITLITPIWFLVLRNHSVIHYWFTWRAGLLSLFSLLLFIYYTTDRKKLFKTDKK